MKLLADFQPPLLADEGLVPEQMKAFPRFRYMGSKFRLIPWIHETLGQLSFKTSTDAFSGSGVVSYLLKSMGKQVWATDSVDSPSVLIPAAVEHHFDLA